MSNNPEYQFWREYHFWQWKKSKGVILRIVKNEKTGKWVLKKRGRDKWKVIEKGFRTRADAIIFAEDKLDTKGRIVENA